VPQRLFGGVVGKRQVGLSDRAQDHVPVVEEFAHDATQHRVRIHLMRFAQMLYFVPSRVSLRRRVRRQRCGTSSAELGAVLAPGCDRQFLTAAMAWTARRLARPPPRPLLGR